MGTRRGKMYLLIMVSVCHQHLDNRPLRFEEFEEHISQIVFVSATPGPYELEHTPMIEQIIRPTGLLGSDY